MPTPTPFVALVDPSTGFASPAVAELSDSSLLQLQRDLAEIRRRVDAWSAAVAGQIANRSRRELGYDGLAQRHGARTPELLVQRLAGTSSRESHTMVRVGRLMGDPSAEAPSSMDAVGAAVTDGRLSLDAADAIRAGLSRVDAAIPAALIATAAESLVEDARVLTVEKLATRAREFGANLDERHVIDRERLLRQARYLRLTAVSDGMTRISGLLDPESAAAIGATFDAITSPRRGGPRFRLVCRHHHLLIHDNGWRVTRQGSDYFVVPPSTIDAARRPIDAPAQAGLARRGQSQAAADYSPRWKRRSAANTSARQAAAAGNTFVRADD